MHSVYIYSCGVVSKGHYICACNIKRLHFEVNFGIERECCLSIEWVWSNRGECWFPRAPKIKDRIDEYSN